MNLKTVLIASSERLTLLTVQNIFKPRLISLCVGDLALKFNHQKLNLPLKLNQPLFQRLHMMARKPPIRCNLRLSSSMTNEEKVCLSNVVEQYRLELLR